MSDKIVYLMRGLPSCGKSHTARKLAGETGVVCETDEYFHTQVGDDPTKFNYRKELMEDARRWNFERFKDAVDRGVSPVVVDRGNSRSTESQQYVRYAMDHGYRVELREPESEWWQEIRVLLKYKKLTKPALYEWADRLSNLSKTTHRVPASTIRTWMNKWKWDLTVEDILNYSPAPEENRANDDTETAAEDTASAEAQSTNATNAEAADTESLVIQPLSADPLTPPDDEAEPDTPLTTRLHLPGEKSPFL